MTWPTVATDGRFIGTPQFLSNYWYDISEYEAREATIADITDENNPDFEVYSIENARGVNGLIMRKELGPMVREVLGVPAREALEGTVVTAYYQDRVIKGLGPRVDSE